MMTDDPFRILVVDNDPRICRDHATNLRRWGYTPVVAQGVGEALMADAIDKAHKECCAIALVDMRLIDDHDNRDISGLKIINDLKPTLSIVVSGKGNRKRAVEALTSRGAVNFIGKEDGPRTLKAAIEAALDQFCPGIETTWPKPQGLRAILQQLEIENDDIPSYALSCLIGKVYAAHGDDPKVTHLTLELLNKHYQQDSDVTSLLRSVVFFARRQGKNDDWFQNEIMKLASAGQIKDELFAYQNFVSPYIRPTRSARIEDFDNASILWRLGAIRYTNIAGGNAKPFRIWYHQRDKTVDWLQCSLRHLYQRTLEPWHHGLSAKQSHRNLYDYYTGVWKDLDEKLRIRARQCKPVSIPSASATLTSPMDWVLRHRHQSDFVAYWNACTHGDLHSDNVFVKDNGDTYIIDYERSGPGHLLRDFVEMEVDILLRLLPLSSVSAEHFLNIGIDLLTPQFTRTPPPSTTLDRLRAMALSEDMPTLAQLDRAFSMIITIRELVHERLGQRPMEEYYWALLMNTLLTLTRKAGQPASEESNARYQGRGTLLSALICERLDRWNDPWPSPDWSIASA